MHTTTYAAATQQVLAALKADEIRQIAKDGYAGPLPEGSESLDENRLRRLIQYECFRRQSVSACETIPVEAITLAPESG